MAIGQVTAKAVLTIINIVFCVIAVILVMIGAWLFSHYFNYQHMATDNSTLISACIVLSVGGLLMVMGILGFVTTFNEYKCLTRLYLCVLVLLLIALIVGSALAYIYRKDIDTTLNKQMLAALDKYAWDSYILKEVDFMQRELKCCGVNNYTDWLETTWYKNQSDPRLRYPSSCCQKNCTYQNPDDNLYKEGCYDKLRNAFLHHLVVVGSVAAGCAVFLLLGIIASAVLLYRRSRETPYIGLPESDGLRV